MTKVTKIGVPVDYMAREKEMDLDWIREQIHSFDFDRVDRVDILLTYYFDINHEGLEPQYLTKAIRLPEEDLNKLHDIRKQTGMTIKLITHMILSIAYNQKIGDGLDE